MKVLITGSSGHLDEALVRTRRALGNTTVGVDLAASPYTDVVASIATSGVAERLMEGVDGVFHSATLHKPHVATHSKAQFVETNSSGTLALLEAARQEQVGFFVFTSTTSVFGDALRPAPGEPAAWITEEVTPRAKNICGATKLAAEDLCLLFHRNHRMNTLVLRTSRLPVRR
jgi:UDP-glucose 4-epimerase